MRTWTVLAGSSLVYAAALSCASSDVAPGRTDQDAGADTSSPPPSSADAASEATAPDAGRPKPLAVECTGDPCFVAVSGNGGHHLCGLLRDGTVRCWGRDTLDPEVEGEEGDFDGALGRGVAVSTLEGATAAPVVGLPPVTQISVGPNLGTCARTSDGAVFCWGRNEDGQLGRPPEERVLHTPTRIAGLPPVKDVQLGQRLGCAIGSADNALYCWGTIQTDPWFESSAFDPDVPAMSSFGPRIVTKVRAPLASLAIGTGGSPAMDTIIALRDDGVLVNLGAHVTGETSLEPPWKAPLEQPGVLVAFPFAYVARDGLVWEWLPRSGISNDLRIHVPLPETIVDLKLSVSSSANGEDRPQGGALLSTGRLFRWGTNIAGMLAIAPGERARAEFPIEVTQLERKVVSFATTAGSACASLVDGTVQCWGANTFGELGRGALDLAPHPDPQAIR